MSKTITLSVPDPVFREMSKHPEINYSELARERITEYLSSFKQKRELYPFYFLVLKDLVFSKERIIEIHEKIEKNRKMTGSLSWVSSVFDMDLLQSMSNFFYWFARMHPFEDGNKRTAFVCVDAFLRLNRLKLKINAKKNKTTEDERFFWQNASQQRNTKQIKDFLKKHLVPCRKPNSVEQAINESIKENRQLLENLSK